MTYCTGNESITYHAYDIGTRSHPRSPHYGPFVSESIRTAVLWDWYCFVLRLEKLLINQSNRRWVQKLQHSYDVTVMSERDIGRIRLSVSTVNRTYELSGITHVTPFRKYGKHSTGPSTCGPWARTYSTYSKLFSCKPVLTIWSYGAQSNEICTYGRVSRETIPRVRRYGLLYLRTVEYDQWTINVMFDD